MAQDHAHWHPGAAHLGGHAGLNGWALPALFTSGDKREHACMAHASLRLRSKPSVAPPPILPRVPTQVNGMPAFRHQLMPGTQLRFDGEWKVLCAL